MTFIDAFHDLVHVDFVLALCDIDDLLFEPSVCVVEVACICEPEDKNKLGNEGDGDGVGACQVDSQTPDGKNDAKRRVQLNIVCKQTRPQQEQDCLDKERNNVL